MTDQIMANDEIDEKNDSAERVFRRGDDSAILRLSESEVQAYTPDDDRRMVINMGPQHPSTHGVCVYHWRWRENQYSEVNPSSDTYIQEWKRPENNLVTFKDQRMLQEWITHLHCSAN